MPKCKGCGDPCERKGLIAICGRDECYKAVAKMAQEKARKAKEKTFKERTRELKEKAKTRADYYKDLQKEVNYYAKHVLYRGHPCYTCGKEQRPTDSGGAFHAGHYRTVGGVPELRFSLRNIRLQCYSCNAIHSGMRLEYRLNILSECGLHEAEWLDGPHPSLKEQLPTIDDIRAEIARYRKLNKAAKADS